MERSPIALKNLNFLVLKDLQKDFDVITLNISLTRFSEMVVTDLVTCNCSWFNVWYHDIGGIFSRTWSDSISSLEFVQVLSKSHLKMRVWERGAGATLACGTGACATVVAAVLEGHAGRICTVDLPGGPLQIDWREEDNHVYMTGSADLVYYGSLPL
ncbi:hypothetical protein V8G54_021763 [Vigna mungo]|uniref:Diaminopimelate epimerase n=1 Tax=Vigna mungo TaxID=3915 RepID=A0AAQ3RW30_VIGMU